MVNNMIREASVKNSALWAAYGDALGFISELANEAGLKWRTNSSEVKSTVKWRRMLGGTYGAEVHLPAGCYSDDTQLRLSTCRAIRGDGIFDVETFAKVELPVWLSYALGAGKGTKLAANSLKQQTVNWFSNFYLYEGSSYFHSGGNGAVMRIHPHVWSARQSTQQYLLDVVRNSICTHGHPRAILGAVFHALCLEHAIQAEVPGPEQWYEFIKRLESIADLISTDSELSFFWLPVWEDRCQRPFIAGIKDVVEEAMIYLTIADAHLKRSSGFSYSQFVEEVGGLKESERGCGFKTSFIAAVLSWKSRNDNPELALLEAVNLLGSDTDSIASMAGAILGAKFDEAPTGKLEDRQYIISEAARLYHISCGLQTESFLYPDIHSWNPPKTNVDALGTIDNNPAVAGLGYATPSSDIFQGRSQATLYQWFQLDFGQTVLLKRREKLKPIPRTSYPKKPLPPKQYISASTNVGQGELFSQKNPSETIIPEPVKRLDRLSIDDLSSEAIKKNFDPEVIGNHILLLSLENLGIEKAIAYTSIIAKARLSRQKAGR